MRACLVSGRRRLAALGAITLTLLPECAYVSGQGQDSQSARNFALPMCLQRVPGFERLDRDAALLRAASGPALGELGCAQVASESWAALRDVATEAIAATSIADESPIADQAPTRAECAALAAFGAADREFGLFAGEGVESLLLVAEASARGGGRHAMIAAAALRLAVAGSTGGGDHDCCEAIGKVYLLSVNYLYQSECISAARRTLDLVRGWILKCPPVKSPPYVAMAAVEEDLALANRWEATTRAGTGCPASDESFNETDGH